MAAQCLQETNRLFGARVQETWKTCKEGGLSDAAKKVLGSLCEKYDNLHAMDKVAATLAKVDAVKLTMQVAAGPLECLECVSPPVAACSLLGVLATAGSRCCCSRKYEKKPQQQEP
jgi:hypothetical protein